VRVATAYEQGKLLLFVGGRNPLSSSMFCKSFERRTLNIL
jgi:hypothetical protein